MSHPVDPPFWREFARAGTRAIFGGKLHGQRTAFDTAFKGLLTYFLGCVAKDVIVK